MKISADYSECYPIFKGMLEKEKNGNKLTGDLGQWNINSTSMYLFEHCDGQTSVDKLIRAFIDMFPNIKSEMLINDIENLLLLAYCLGVVKFQGENYFEKHIKNDQKKYRFEVCDIDYMYKLMQVDKRAVFAKSSYTKYRKKDLWQLVKDKEEFYFALHRDKQVCMLLALSPCLFIDSVEIVGVYVNYGCCVKIELSPNVYGEFLTWCYKMICRMLHMDLMESNVVFYVKATNLMSKKFLELSGFHEIQGKSNETHDMYEMKVSIAREIL